MKNKLDDLNDHLFAQIERLSNEGLNGDDLKKEIDRSKAITDLAKEVVSNASLQLSAIKLKAEYSGLKDGDISTRLIGDSK
jgi:hypothetical protein